MSFEFDRIVDGYRERYPTVLSTAQVAEMLGTDPEVVRARVAEGDLRAYRWGRKLRFVRDEVLDSLHRQRVDGSSVRELGEPARVVPLTQRDPADARRRPGSDALRGSAAAGRLGTAIREGEVRVVSAVTLKKVRDWLAERNLRAADYADPGRVSQREIAEDLGLHPTTVARAMQWLRLMEQE